MATFSTRLLLRKPDPDPITGDNVNVQTDLNENFDKLDAAMGAFHCTSGTRPATPFLGQFIRETDTGNLLLCTNTVGPVWTLVYTAGPGGSLTVGGNLAVSGIGQKLFVRKSASEPIANNTMQDDDHLFLALGLNSTYILDGILRYSCASGTPGIKIQFSFPAGTVVAWGGIGPAYGLSAQVGATDWYSPAVAVSPTPDVWYGTNDDVAFPVFIRMTGMVRTTGTAGALKVRWAQITTTTGSPVTMHSDSWMSLERVA